MSDDRERNPASPAVEQAAPPTAGKPDASAVGEPDVPVTESGAAPAGKDAALPDADHPASSMDEDAPMPAVRPPTAAQDAASPAAPDRTADAAPAGPREPDEDALRLAEALIFASAEPVSARALTRVLPDDIDADAVLGRLRERYAGRGVELADIGNGVMFRTALDLAPRLRKVIEVPRRLPRVALETLAIIAYHQPMTRPEIEHIRGTALSQQTLDALLELNLIAPKGRRETPGRPTLWGTTPEFLAHFGLKDLRELPRREDLLLETAPPRSTPEALPADLQTPPEIATNAPV
jgi:segregation and condensation protein B